MMTTSRTVIGADVRSDFPGRKEGRTLSKEEKNVTSDPQTTFSEPPDDEEPPPDDDYRPGEYSRLVARADEIADQWPQWRGEGPNPFEEYR
jgi:hypothetical protein